jgi:hypothetical protein
MERNQRHIGYPAAKLVKAATTVVQSDFGVARKSTTFDAECMCNKLW